MLVAQDDRRVYEARGNPKLQTILMLGGGVVFLLPAFFLFIVLLGKEETKPNSFQPGLIGGMMVVPIMAIARGLFLLRSTHRVIIDEKGISLEGPTFFKAVAWNEIERIAKKERSSGFENHDAVILFGAGGKQLAEIRDTVDRFGELVEQITDRSTTARGTPTFNAAEDEAAQSKSERRKLRVLGILFGLFA